MMSLKLKEEIQKGTVISAYTVRGACYDRGSPWSHGQETGAPKEWLSLSPYSALNLLWMEPVLVRTGSRAKTLFHQASAPMTDHRALKKYLTPVSGFSLLSLDLPGSWDNANGFELTSVGKCRCWMKNWKMCSTFSSFLFYFCNLYCTHPGSHYFGHVFL